MAYQVGLACYGTPEQAAQAQASTQTGAIVSHGGTLYTVNASSVTADAITYALAPVDGGAALTHTASYTAQPCNLLQLEDGMQIGWMVAAVWLGAYAVLFIARVLRGESSDYGNA